MILNVNQNFLLGNILVGKPPLSVESLTYSIRGWIGLFPLLGKPARPLAGRGATCQAPD